MHMHVIDEPRGHPSAGEAPPHCVCVLSHVRLQTCNPPRKYFLVVGTNQKFNNAVSTITRKRKAHSTNFGEALWPPENFGKVSLADRCSEEALWLSKTLSRLVAPSGFSSSPAKLVCAELSITVALPLSSAFALASGSKALALAFASACDNVSERIVRLGFWETLPPLPP